MKHSGYQRKAERKEALKPTNVEIKGKQYRLIDISNDGIGLIVGEDASGFFIGQRIDAISISLQQQSKILKGVVAHLSKNEENHICGIRFLFDSRAEFEYVTAFKKNRTAA